MNSCKYADVIVDISHEKLDKPFTYMIPEELRFSVVPGTPVIVPFGSSDKEKKGYVISVYDEQKPGNEGFVIKSIISVATKKVSIEDELIELSAWMKDRYGCTMSTALKTVLPVKQQVKARNGYVFSKVSSGYTLHKPNDEQEKAIKEFTDNYDKGIHKAYLLYGITGSGKTDVYLHIMKHVADSGRQVILLTPEISLTYQAIERLYSVFGDRIAVIHSKLSPGERYEQIKRCKDGTADIIVGPRSALFAPFKNIGLIVIDEEHDNAYKNENIPRYNAIDVAIKRADMQNASLILASATPTPDSYEKAISGEYRLLSLTQRAGNASMPDIEVVDMREELRAGNRSIFSERLDILIRDRLAKHEQVILFINRRGYSNFVSCRSCGNAIRCPHCDVSMTTHIGHRLVCHYCGYELPMPKLCPVCGSPYIAEFGVGTQKLEKMTMKMYPEARVARLDTDSAAGKKAAEQILSDFAAGRTDILIGTQMVVKGHDYHNVTLVGIMAADTSLYVSNYESGQRTYELISQAAGRAGRGSKKGCVVIQTYKPEHYAISCAANNDFDSYYENEMSYRKMLNYPPAIHIWTAQLSGKDEKVLERAAQEFSETIKNESSGDGGQFIGPVKPSVYKVNDYFRMLTYYKHSNYDTLLTVKEKTEEILKDKLSKLNVSVIHDFT